MKTLRSTTTLFLAALVAVVLTTACATTQTPGQQVSDAELATRVKAKLAADPEVNPFNVDVDADAGMIRLSGRVDDNATRDEAGKLARETSGVMGVDNNITVGEETVGEVIDDAVIVTKVKSKLVADLEVAANNIDVDSEQGVVTLSGTVRSNEAREEAEKLARDTHGVVRVDNEIKRRRVGLLPARPAGPPGPARHRGPPRAARGFFSSPRGSELVNQSPAVASTSSAPASQGAATQA